MPATNELSDNDVGVSWDKGNVLSDADVGVSWESPRLSPQEFEALPRSDYTITPRDRQPATGRMATPEETAESEAPMISPQEVRRLMDLSTKFLPQTSELLFPNTTEGMKEGISEMISGMTTPRSIGKLALYTVPVAGQGLAAFEGGEAAGGSLRELVEAIKSGDDKRAGKAVVGLAGGLLMAKGGVELAKNLPTGPVETYPRLPSPDELARGGMEPSPAIGQPPPNEISHKLTQAPLPPEMIQVDPAMRRFANIDVNDLQILPSAEEQALAATREQELRGRQTLPPGGEQIFNPLEATETGRTAEMKLLQRSAEGAERGNETLPVRVLFQEQPQAEPALPEVYRKPLAEEPGVPTQQQLLEERLGRHDLLESVKKLGETPASIAPKLIDALRGRPQTSIRTHADEITWRTIIDKLEQERLGPKYQPPEGVPPEVAKAQVAAVANAEAVGLTRSAAAATEAITGEKPNASRKPNAAGSTEREVRARMGEETSLRQQGAAPEVRPREQVNEPGIARPEERPRSAQEQKPEVPLVDQLSALKSTEEATNFGRTQKTPEGIAALEAARAELVRRWKAGDATAERPAYLAREALQAAKGEEGALAAGAGNKITKETQPERVVVQSEATTPEGEKVPGYVTIQSKGNAQSGAPEAWRAAGHDIPDFSKLPQGSYTIEEARAKLKEGELNAQKEKEAQGNVLGSEISPGRASATEPTATTVPTTGQPTEPTTPATAPAAPRNPSLEEIGDRTGGIDLTEPVPDTTLAKARVKRAEESKADLRKKYDELKKELDTLSKSVISQRSSRFRKEIKASARKLDVQRYRALQTEMSKLDEAMRTLDDQVRDDRRLVGYQETIDVINDEKRPLLQRLDRKIRLLQDRGQELPEGILEARARETARVIRNKYPDATAEEIKTLSGPVQVGASLYGEPWADLNVPDLNALRHRKIDALLNGPETFPREEFSEDLKAKLQKAGMAKEPVSAKQVAEIEKAFKSDAKTFRDKQAAAQKAHEEATARAKAEEEKMLADAQKIVDSAPRSRDAVAIKNELAARLMEKARQLADADGVTIRQQPDSKTEFVAESSDKANWAWGTIEPKGKGFSVETWRPQDTKNRLRVNVGTMAEAQDIVRGMAAKGTGRTVVAVPGDGIYRIVNDGAKLMEVWRKAKALNTSKGGGTTVSRLGGYQDAPAEIKTESDWREAKNFHALEPGDTIHDWSPALRKVAEKVNPEAPEKVTVKDVDAYLEKKKAELTKPSDTAKKIANKIREQLKTPETGGELHSFGVVPKVINAAVEVAARIIEAGGTVADAIAEAIDYVRRNHTGNFNEGGFRRMLEKQYAKAGGTPPPAAPPPPTPPTPPAPGAPGAPVPPPITPASAAGTIMRRMRAIRDYMTVDPIPRLTREMGAGAQTAFEHAKARGAVPPMINNLLAKVFPDQYHDPAAMARTMDVLKKDDILGGYDDFRAREAEAMAKGDARDAARWRNLADRIGSVQDLHQLALDVEAGRRDPVISANISRWKEFVNPELDQLYNEMKGVDPNTPREGRGRVFGARVNLLPRVEEAKWQNALTGEETTPLPQQNASNYRNPNARRDKFDRVAKLTGDYSDNPAAILANVLFHRWNEVTKIRFYNELVRSEVGSWEQPADGTLRGEPASRLAVKVPETNEAGVTRQVEKSLWVPQSMVDEIRGVLSTDLNLKNHPVGDVLNKLQIAQFADFVAHTKNQVSAVAQSPQMSGYFSELARRFPGVNIADAVVRIGKAAWDIHRDTPAIRAEIAGMAKNGLLRERTIHQEAKIWKPLQYTHDFLYRNDVAMRLVMNRFYDTLVRQGLAPENLMERRKFVSQAGEYNSRLLGPMMRAARSSGAAPFIVAGRNFNRYAVRRITGAPGFKPTSAGASALLRSANVYTLAATVAVPMILNYFMTGRITGRPGTPLGAIDLGGQKDERGNFRIFDLAQIQGIRRGARITGLDALSEGLLNNRDADEIVGKAFGESAQAMAHPWLGPAPAFAARAVFGKNLDLRAGPQPEEARNMGSPFSINQKLENARVALKNQNRPLYGLAVRPFVGDTEEGYLKDLLGDVSRSPLSAGGSRKTVSPALEEARSLSITGTPATVESVERAKLKRKLAKAMMAGDDKPTQDALDAGIISKRDVTELEQKTTQEPLEYLVHRHLSTEQAMRVWHLATPEEKKILFDVVADKINRDQKSSEEKIKKWTEELNSFQE